jgi:phenylacetate-CoA ligase
VADSRSLALYSRLPIWAQNVACTVMGVRLVRERYNRTFHEALDFLEESQTWPLAQLQEDQDIRVRRLIRHAFDTVPYYREVMEARKLTPGDIRCAADLPKLPILEKSTLRRRQADLKSRGWPARRIRHEHTGGTTGTAVHFDVDSDTRAWQWAIWWRHRRRFGMDLSQPFIVFAGRPVVPLAQRDPPIWRRNLAMKQTYVSVHHMTRQNMPALVDYLDSRDVPYYSGYPSALYLLAAYLLETGRTLRHPPRITVTGAETVLPHQRDVIQRGLDTELADQYGASENCGNISECRRHRYHVDMEFGVIELEPMAGMPAESGSILCTGLHNYAMPLIRYAIGDVATRSSDPCDCGLQAPAIARIDGRIESYIITPDGRQLGRLDFLFKDSLAIEEAQFVQDAPDHVVMRIVRGPSHGPDDEAALLVDFRRYAGHEIRVDFEYVAAIPREPNGKFRQIVSHVFRDPDRDAGRPA